MALKRWSHSHCLLRARESSVKKFMVMTGDLNTISNCINGRWYRGSRGAPFMTYNFRHYFAGPWDRPPQHSTGLTSQRLSLPQIGYLPMSLFHCRTRSRFCEQFITFTSHPWLFYLVSKPVSVFLCPSQPFLTLLWSVVSRLPIDRIPWSGSVKNCCRLAVSAIKAFAGFLLKRAGAHTRHCPIF